jgi:hypothetical protein
VTGGLLPAGNNISGIASGWQSWTICFLHLASLSQTGHPLAPRVDDREESNEEIVPDADPTGGVCRHSVLGAAGTASGRISVRGE